MCYYFFGILVLLTVFSIGHIHGECNKEDPQKMLNEIRQSTSSVSKDTQYVHLYQKMEREYPKFMRYLFDCDDYGKLFDQWDKLKKKLLDSIKKSCPDFESSFGEIKHCRVNLDAFNFDTDQTKYCSTFEKCSGMHGRTCAPLNELVLLDNRQSNASAHFCTIECDDIQKLRKVLANCWASVQITGRPHLFELFSDCVMATTKPTCRITKRIIYRIYPLFNDHVHEIVTETVSEKPESKCIQKWNVLKDIEDLKPSMCKMLEDMKPCITKFLKGNNKRYKEKLAKCQYSVVNLIKTEALHHPTEKPTPAPSTAAGKLGSGTYHLAVICWLVTMVTYYFTKII